MKSKNDKEKYETQSTKTNMKTNEKKITKKKVQSYITMFQRDGLSYLHTLNERQIEIMIEEMNKAYYNETPYVLDEQYDIIKDYMELHYPQNKILKQVGAIVPIEKNKVKLPYYMPSMNKIKPDTKNLFNWKTNYNGPYTLSVKLDGISGLYVIENGEKKLYTRGNGEYGQDISYLIPYLKLPYVNLHQETQPANKVSVRGEIIMKKEIFNSLFQEQASNIRNFVSGIINSKKTNSDKYQYLEFVGYEVIEPILKPKQQFHFLQEYGFQTALWREETNETLTNELLSNYLTQWRETYEYEIDGVIVSDNSNIYNREKDNPKHSFAFKMVLTDQVVEATVVDVLWNISKDGYLKPRVQIEPVVIGGAKIEYTTGFNGKYIKDNKIGVGAVIQLVRSGDVIPYIMKVIKPAHEAKMPLDIEYKWNETGIDIVVLNTETNNLVREKRIVKFFSDLEVECFNKGNITRFINAGYNSISSILQMTYDDYLSIDGVREKMAKKIYHSLCETIKKTTISKLMMASNIFGRGFGEKKLNTIIETYPYILNKTSFDINTISDKKALIEKINSMEGFGIKTATLFVEKLPHFYHFLNETKLLYKLEEYNNHIVGEKEKLNEEKKHMNKKINKGKNETIHPLSGKKIVLTGFRNKELEKQLNEVGASLCSTVSKKTDIVIIKSKNDKTNKSLKAIKLDIPRIELDEFREKYHI